MQLVPRDKDISGCAIAGIMSEAGRLFDGEQIIRAIAVMHERSNGLGGGFAAYGIYPEHRDRFALHLMCDDHDARKGAERIMARFCKVHHEEPIPTRRVEAVRRQPVLHRYFVTVKPHYRERDEGATEEDVVVQLVMTINSRAAGAFVFSSGRDMGVFKGVGYAEDIGRFYRLEEYRAHTWIAHGRFPTNSSGWWGGAHPFGLLEWAVVHNGEISSYGINRRYLANFGYDCTLQTDTEVITYLFDLLMRRHGLPLDAACMAMAPPFWSQIERMPADQQRLARTIRAVYGGALLNGPFSVLVGHAGGMIALNDRTKLRPMVAARRGDMLYVASEEASVREVCREPEALWHARGGVPIVGQLGGPPSPETRQVAASAEPAAASAGPAVGVAQR